MGNLVEVLQNEHLLLRHAVATTEKVQKIQDNDLYHTKIHPLLLFFKNFTDLYHHPKEDMVLNQVQSNQKMQLDPSILNTIASNREDLDQMLAEIIDAYMAYEVPQLRAMVGKYTKELTEQMDQEDNIILKNAFCLLTEHESDQMYRSFMQLDGKDMLLGVLRNDYYKFSSQNQSN